jgi:hypothetical protein
MFNSQNSITMDFIKYVYVQEADINVINKLFINN